MAGRRAKRNSWVTILLVLAAVALWVNEQRKDADRPAPSSAGETARPGKPDRAPAPATRTGGYETYRNCSLVAEHNNDGDSFRVRLPDGRAEIVRLYFVDTPESAFTRYRDGETNHRRIRSQAQDLGGLTPEQAVDIGVRAKKFALGLLERRPFTIHTAWDSPYQDQRYHAFVEVEENGKSRWLHEILIERGLARILTKPADLPDGTKADAQLRRLRSLEKAARAADKGAWGM